MVTVKVLVEGYAETRDGVEHASSTVTLLQEHGINVIVDPGMDKEKLLLALKKEGLTPADVQYVVVTHTHMDHCFLVALFEHAMVVDNDSLYSADGTIAPHQGFVPGTSMRIIHVPGHDQFHCAVVAETKELGTVVVAADVWWWRVGEVQETTKEDLLRHADPYMKNWSALQESRNLILQTADYVIPGHGKMFRVER